jgi:uncharacterized protein (TIGR02145 family)
MKHSKNFIVLTLLIAITLGAVNCVVPSLVGNSSEVDNKICGKLFNPDGKTPAKHVSVVMRPRDYLAKINMMGKRQATNGIFICSTYTDTAGYYRFTSDDSIPERAYCIEARDSRNNCVLIDSVEIAADMSIMELIDTLKPPANLLGKVPWNPDSLETYVRVFGLNVITKVKPDSSFSLDNLPEGDLRLQMLVFRHGRQSCDTTLLQTATTSGDIARIYPVTFDSRGGSEIAPQLLNYNDPVTQPTPPTSKACSFAGWYKEPMCTTEWQFAKEKVVSPTTIYAKWIVVDVDGNVYTTVKIGNQVWLASDLKTTKYNDSVAIPLISDSTLWDSITTPAYGWYYDYKAGLKAAFGPLYNWYAVHTGKLAPAGWHVSTDGDWDTLQNTLLAQGYGWDGTTGITIVKALAAQSNWDSSTNIGAIGNDPSKNNGTGFSALPGLIFNLHGCWWTTFEFNESEAVSQTMSWYIATISRERRDKKYGSSIRCIRDE